MLVKKFEASTMKEALEMVKQQLGPEAIILSAKDHKSSYGLLGKNSIEVTAAISEGKLRQKQAAEARLAPAKQVELRSKSAKSQREFIEKSVRRFIPPSVESVIIDEMQKRSSKPAPAAPPVRVAARDWDQIRSERYIDIEDDPQEPAYANDMGVADFVTLKGRGRTVTEMIDAIGSKVSNSLTQKAKPPEEVAQEIGLNARPITGANPRVSEAVKSALNAFDERPSLPSLTDVARGSASASTDVVALREEINQLRGLIEALTHVPTDRTSGRRREVTRALELMSIQLEEGGVPTDEVQKLIAKFKNQIAERQWNHKGIIESWVATELLDSLKVVDDSLDGRVHFFVGPASQGKTTALVKYAMNLSLKHSLKVGILSSDTQRVGAAEQLKIYSQIMGARFATVQSLDDLTRLVSAWSDLDVLLVDTASNSVRTLDEYRVLKDLLRFERTSPTVKRHLVVSATSSKRYLDQACEKYGRFSPKDIIVTHLDLCIEPGVLVSVCKAHNLPLHSFSTGVKVPEDWEPATSERIVDLILNLSSRYTKEFLDEARENEDNIDHVR